WLDARARWVRFNPDVHYLESVMGKKVEREVQCPAGDGWIDKTSRLVEPEETAGGPSDAQGWPLQHVNWPIVLTATIFRNCRGCTHTCKKSRVGSKNHVAPASFV